MTQITQMFLVLLISLQFTKTKINMENFIEFKNSLIKDAVNKEACKSQVERAKECQTWDELKVVIADNIGWLRAKKVKIIDGHYKSSLREFTIVNGLLHGEYKERYLNGLLWINSHYENGVRHGEWKSWWRNGQPMVHCTYKDEELHGEYKRWYENGQLCIHEHYENGQKVKTIV